ncbi:unnamed protein product [Vitrella brassicaformis CCMP3155]|uniref:Uncharacterized protein n=2 Tax=Vitrella brassicaformis TaxID=1169539 RepID=A0A0G4EG83_VITBC|nr:unnamed protein product [Vitrella brassicaformis CCMP3155]|eukprot:CEL94500.1 unnamed protein product [Vitrella brassicaformis CCMP3155]
MRLLRTIDLVISLVVCACVVRGELSCLSDAFKLTDLPHGIPHHCGLKKHNEDGIHLRINVHTNEAARLPRYEMSVVKRKGGVDEQLLHLNSSRHAFVTRKGQTMSPANGALNLTKQTYLSEPDYDYERWRFYWGDKQLKAKAPPKQAMRTQAQAPVDYLFATKIHRLGSSCVFFDHFFPFGLQDTAAADKDDLSTAFPVFDMPSAEQKIGYASLYGPFGWSPQYGPFSRSTSDVKKIPKGIKGGLPLFLFDEKQQFVCVVSPANRFESFSLGVKNDTDGSPAEFQMGVMGSVESYGHLVMHTMVFCTEGGMNEAIDKWGVVLRSFYPESERRPFDLFSEYVTYWTDNGAYYYYHTEEKTSYEDSLLGVQRYWQEQTPMELKGLQLDSWFYRKTLKHQGTYTWDADAEIFPNGLRELHKKLGLPLAAHNRYFATDSPYDNANGGKYSFIRDTDSQMAVSVDPVFWHDLYRNATGWGLRMYEQDWLYFMVEFMPQLTQDVNLLARYMSLMTMTAGEYGVAVQLCMPYPRHIMAAVQYNPVASIRASDDYTPGNLQWDIGITAPIIRSLGIAPFKDVFWSTNATTDKYGGFNEPFPDLQLAMATLSTGPVAVGDKIGLTDWQLVAKCCRQDGRILKPSRPIAFVDSHYSSKAFKAPTFGSGGVSVDYADKMYYTYTHIGKHRFYIFLGFRLTHDYHVSLDHYPHLKKWDMWAIWRPTQPDKVELWTADSPLVVPAGGLGDRPHLVYASPLWTHGQRPEIMVALIGEPDKIVPISPKRFDEVFFVRQGTTYHLHVLITGVPGETVKVRSFMTKDGGSTFDTHVAKFTFSKTSGGGGLGERANQDGSVTMEAVITLPADDHSEVAVVA